MARRPLTAFIRELSLITLARLLLNTGLRMVYPFAPAFARGLGVPVADIYRLIFWRSLAGLLSPLFSPLSERYGRVPVMVGSMFLFGLSCLVVIMWPVYAAFGLTLFLIALAKVIFDPAMQAYIGERVPYSQRGKAISVTELSWAGALLVGGPAISLTMTRWGWQAPFVWLALLAVVAGWGVWQGVPRTFTALSQGVVTLRQTAVIIRRHRVIWAAIAYTSLAMAANETLLIVFGDWMESRFGLSLIALGFSAGVIGVAEIVGEVAAGWSVDRFGKRPVIICAGLLNALATLLLPFSGVALPLVLAAYFVVFLFFEIMVVGGVPLLTEIVPAARAVVMSSVMAAAALGRAMGAWLGPHLFAEFGFGANGVMAAVMMAMAVLLLAVWVKEGKVG